MFWSVEIKGTDQSDRIDDENATGLWRVAVDYQ